MVVDRRDKYRQMVLRGKYQRLYHVSAGPSGRRVEDFLQRG